MITVEKFLNFHDTLNCGQVFRFFQKDDCYLVISKDKIAKVFNFDGKAYVKSDDEDYFKGYFDLEKDYGSILKTIQNCNIKKVLDVAEKYSGIRILRQDREEALFSFIVSQNNNIPRIKSTIEKLCASLGASFTFENQTYYAFPSAQAFAEADISLLRGAGLGYRAEYIKETAQKIVDKQLDLDYLSTLSTEDLRKQLLKIKGVGDKVANCVTLFGFGRGDSFPVDTWIEKIYREDFDGKLTDRTKISRYFLDLFKENSGIIQQYLFYAKRESFI